MNNREHESALKALPEEMANHIYDLVHDFPHENYMPRNVPTAKRINLVQEQTPREGE